MNQHSKNFHNLVFAGGGVLGVAYVGALEAIEKKAKPIGFIQKFCGTSVGSILATMCALRYSPADIKKIMQDLDFKKLADQGYLTINIFDIKNIFNARNRFGLNSGNFLENWVEGLISKKIGKKNATFTDLKSKSDFGELYIVASAISEGKPGIYSAQNTPNVIISKAVRASASIPIFFDIVIEGDSVKVDGGLYRNYPINVFDKDKFKDTLGIDFTVHPLAEIIKNNNITAQNIQIDFGLQKYILALAASSLTVQDIEYANSENSNRSIIINDLGISPMDFSFTNQQKEKLFQEGYNDAMKYFT